jgi:hypothetical protein
MDTIPGGNQTVFFSGNRALKGIFGFKKYK